jgi:hypothetical protein
MGEVGKAIRQGAAGQGKEQGTGNRGREREREQGTGKTNPPQRHRGTEK